MAKIAVIKDCAEGNASVGTEWQEVAVFNAACSLAEVLKWANSFNQKGRLSLVEIHDKDQPQ